MDTVATQLKLALLAISLLFLPFLQATDFKYCDNGGNYVVKVNGIYISPNPVVSGKPATFSISASTGQAISRGKALATLYSHNQVLPGFTPPGSYTLKMTLTGDGIPQLTCISFDFKIGFGASGFSISDA
ncbi:hypothetical protein Golob_019645 [Gossypium lobatum]|uniref:MD-2-related lipid-recognition domain-containing protein n=1 Tax=Gossypium lobatum TaxID=34289 RepID=A0A7J8L805_9ROSI|nr:hypothetical protein [Gossypium lobatum]